MSLSLFLSESNTLELPKSTGTAVEMRKYFFDNLRNPNDVIVQPPNSQQSDPQNFVVGSSSR